MKKFITQLKASVLTLTVLLFAFVASAHQVDGYSGTCNGSSQYAVTATMSSNNNNSNYRWQWKNTSGAWICFVNGNNSINGTNYNVINAVVNLTNLTSQTMTFTNPGSGLQNLEMRMVISDGSGVNPCNLPSGNTWSNASGVSNHHINLTSTNCATCTGAVANVFFNEISGGTDIAITNGGTYTLAQLGSLYNLEASYTGTVGSMLFTVTGPTSFSNTENTAPYNSPSTGVGAFTPAVGTYTVNVKSYNGPDKTGKLCGEVHLTFNVVGADCSCPGSIITNGSFENGITGWNFTGGNFYTNTYVPVCGTKHGEFQSTTSSGGFYQEFTNIAVGSVLTLSGYAGVHNNSFDAFVGFYFIDATGNVISTSLSSQVDNILPSMVKKTVVATVPAGTVKVWVGGYTTGDFLKVDQFCLTNVPPVVGSIGDRVWFDANGNGIQDAAETTGIAGVTVQLVNTSNAVLATTTTNASGNYLFSGLAAGTYRVKFPTAINGSVVTGQNQGTNAAVDSDPSQSTGITNNIVLGAGVNNLTVDAGYCPTFLVLGNFVWNDINNNGVQDASEAGIVGATVNLYADANGDNIADAAAIATTTTNATGNYSFSNLAPGNFIVGVTVPAGFLASANTLTSINPNNDNLTDNNGINLVGGELRSNFITLSGGGEPTADGDNSDGNLSLDFGLTPSLKLGDRVFYDVNDDGIRQASDAGIEAVTVNLYLDANNDNVADGAAIQTTVTDATGFYFFDGVRPNNYIVGVVVPAGYRSSTLQNIDPDNNTDLDDNGNNTVVNGEVRGLAITLLSGTENFDNGNFNNTYDFGFTGTASIGDFVWNDLNGNGVQDAGEPGLAGVTVTLRDAANNVVGTTTTTAVGAYSFTNLAPGTYNVTFGTPANFDASPANQGTDDTKDSDPVAGVVSNIVLTAGQTNNTVDAGFVSKQLSLGDFVWYDINNNGVQDAGEPGIAGATARLYADANADNVADGAALATTTTSATGIYSFTGLTPGNYIVGVTTPAGYAQGATTATSASPNNDNLTDNNGATVVATEVRSNFITLTTNGEPTTDGDGNNGNLSLDFGFRGTASIGDFVWNDLNGNGVQDAGEPGLTGVTVTLRDAANNVVGTTTTTAAGAYSFTNLAPGTYSVTFGTPANYQTSPANQGADDTKDSDPVAGVVSNIVLTAGQTNNTVDAGFVSKQLSLGDFVWYDINNNGVQDAGEPGIAGATARLYADANGDNIADGAALATTTTSAVGIYSFTGLTPGNYIVGVTTPAGYAQGATTATSASPNNDNLTDNNGATVVATEVRSNFITLTTAGEPTTDGDGNNGNLSLDFGFKGTASIGDFVWDDLNGNGVQDAGEPGLAGVTVTLRNAANNVVGTTTTTATGAYSFTNLAPGTYSVAFGTPANYQTSPANQGADDTKDSDPINGVVSGIVLTAGQINNTIDAGFFGNCSITSGITGPATICANEGALFIATGAGVGATYAWTFQNGSPATATGASATSSWGTAGEYLVTLVVTKGACTATYTKTIVITSAVFAAAGPDADICQGGNAILSGSGPVGATYSWVVVAGDPTSIDNGANQNNLSVSPLATTVYRLTVSQNGCTRTDEVTVFINVNKNPTANAGPNRTTCVGVPVLIGGNPTGTPPVSSPTAPLGYSWTPIGNGLNDNTVANPSVTKTVAGTYDYQVIVYSLLTGCSDTAVTTVTVQPNSLSLGNQVWYDADNDGLRANDEPGVADATVRLYADANNDNVADGAAIATTTTSTTGTYNFTGLCSGNYIVGVTPPTGYVPVTNNASDPDNDVDNDNNGVNIVGTEVRSLAVTLTLAGEPLLAVDGDGADGNNTVDFALYGTGRVGNYVWNDANRNGIQDAGEMPIAGAVVRLQLSNGKLLSRTTGTDGLYLFQNLPAGTYSVNFVTPARFKSTASNVTIAGATDENDSDPISGVVSVTLGVGETNLTVDAGFSAILSIFGNVWYDANALADNFVNSTSTTPIPTGLRAYLVDNTTGLIAARVNVLANGTFSFLNADANKPYRVIVSTVLEAVGALPPAVVLPSGWSNTGERLGNSSGILPGSDGLPDGRLVVPTQTSDVLNVNFGIRLKNGDVVIG